MSDIDINQLLSQLRATAAAAQGRTPPPATEQAQGADFAALVKHAMASVSETQNSAQQLATAFEKGDPSVNIADVMVSLQKANISFQAMTQVRNKLVAAYQEIMNMPV